MIKIVIELCDEDLQWIYRSKSHLLHLYNHNNSCNDHFHFQSTIKPFLRDICKGLAGFIDQGNIEFSIRNGNILEG